MKSILASFIDKAKVKFSGDGNKVNLPKDCKISESLDFPSENMSISYKSNKDTNNSKLNLGVINEHHDEVEMKNLMEVEQEHYIYTVEDKPNQLGGIDSLEKNTSYENVEEVNWDDVQDILSYNSLRADELDIAMLPNVLGEYVFEQSKSVNDTSPDYLAVSTVVAAASLIGGSAIITPKKNDKSWEVKPTLWGVIIGEPSKYKTPMLSKGISPIINAQKQYIDKKNIEGLKRQKFKDEVVRLKKQELEKTLKKAVLEGKESKVNQIGIELSSLELDNFLEREVLITDATPEALLQKLQSNPLGILLYRDELSGVFASMTKAGREQERALLLEGFNASGSPYTQERIGREKLIVPCVHINILGGIQPKMLLPIIADRKSGIADDGLLERFQLMVYPNDKTTSYTDVLPSTKSKEKINNIFLLLAKLGDFEEKKYSFDNKAQLLWDQWSIEFHKQLGGLTHDQQSIETKYPALVAKLALVFHILLEAENHSGGEFSPLGEVSPDSLKMALDWLQYLRTHSNKVLHMVSNEEDKSVSALITKLPQLGKSFTRHVLSQKCWKNLTKSEDRNRALKVLEGAGYIKEITKPKTGFIVNPKVLYKGKVS